MMNLIHPDDLHLIKKSTKREKNSCASDRKSCRLILCILSLSCIFFLFFPNMKLLIHFAINPLTTTWSLVFSMKLETLTYIII